MVSRRRATRPRVIPRIEPLEYRVLFSTFSAYADFSTAANPNGVWSYGENAGSGLVLDPLPTAGAMAYTGTGTAGTTTVIQANSATQSLTLKPGNPSMAADVRWTAPAAGTYSITGTFSDSTGIASTSVHVLLNGDSLVTGSITPGGTSSIPINQSSVTVSAGATIDFTVGAGTQGYSTVDQTALQATIATTTTPTNNGSLTPSVSGRLPTKPFVSGQRTTPFYQVVRLTNTSNATVRGPVAINLLLSSAPGGEFGDPTIASISRRVALRPNGRTAFAVLVRSLPPNTSGTFYILASVTDPSGDISTAPTSGTITMDLPQHELTAVFGAGIQRRALAGHNLLLPIIVSNNGNVQALTTIGFDVVATATASSIDLGTVNKRVFVNPGRREVLLLVEHVPADAAAGTYSVKGTIDPNFVYNDMTVTNNMFASPLTVTIS
jgi:hypothetical protein